MKKVISLIVLLMVIVLNGCASKATPMGSDQNTESLISEKMIPVSVYYDAPFQTNEIDKFQAIKEKIYYVRSNWNSETEKLEGVLYKRSATQESPEIEIGDFREDLLIEYLADQNENIYILYSSDENNKKIPYLRKVNESGQEIYRTSLEEYMVDNQWSYIVGGAADARAGYVFLMYRKSIFCLMPRDNSLRRERLSGALAENRDMRRRVL